MEQLTVYVDETIPMVITDDDVTQMANETIDYVQQIDTCQTMTFTA